MVWPALLPPWKRITSSARSASRSVTFPFPSSPHWAPTITIPGMLAGVYEGVWRAGRASGGAQLHAAVGAEERQGGATHLDEPRDRARGDLLLELLVVEVGDDDDRPLVLVARVDDGVQLLEHPLVAALGADVVDVQEVHRREALQQAGVGAGRVVVVGAADVGEQGGQRVDAHGAPGCQRGLGDQHGQRGLAGAHVPEQPQAPPLVEALGDAVGEATDLADDGRVHVRRDRWALEGDVAVAA